MNSNTGSITEPETKNTVTSVYMTELFETREWPHNLSFQNSHPNLNPEMQQYVPVAACIIQKP